jgi:hypothetical protein
VTPFFFSLLASIFILLKPCHDRIMHLFSSRKRMPPIDTSIGAPEKPTRREFAWLIAVVAGIRLLALAIDSHPRFFLGDSESYLFTQLKGWIPPDRSWFYGLGANFLLSLYHRFISVILIQSLLSIILYTITAALLFRLGVRRWLVWAVLLLLSIEPAFLFYDRALLTDSPCAAALWTGIVLTAMGMLRGGARYWAGAAIALSFAAFLRTAALPLILATPIFALGAGIVSTWRESGSLRRLWMHIRAPGCVLAVVLSALALYAVIAGRLTQSKPSLNPKSGYFMISTVSPLLAPEDFAGLSINNPEQLLRETRSKEFYLRNAQIFSDQGLGSRIERELGSWQAASKVAAIAACRCILRDPKGYAGLVMKSAGEYIDFQKSHQIFKTSFGLDRPLSENMLTGLSTKVRDKLEASMPWKPSPLLRYLNNWAAISPLIVWMSLLMPFAALIPIRRPPGAWPVVLLIIICCWIQPLTAFALGTECTLRYLFPFIIPILIIMAVEIDRWLSLILQRFSKNGY